MLLLTTTLPVGPSLFARCCFPRPQVISNPQAASVYNVSSPPASKNDDCLKPRDHPSPAFKTSRIRLLLLQTLGFPSRSHSRTLQDSGYIQDLFEPSSVRYSSFSSSRTPRLFQDVALHTSYSKSLPVSSSGRRISMSSLPRETKVCYDFFTSALDTEFSVL
jgi:hypothetical protein